MSRNEGKGIVRVDLDIDLKKTTTDEETAAVEQKTLSSMRSAGGKREAAKDRQIDICIRAGHELPMGKIVSLLLQRIAQFQQGISPTDFLQSQDIRVNGPNTLADFGLGIVTLGGTGSRGRLEIVFEIIGCHAKACRPDGVDWKTNQRQANKQGERVPTHELVTKCLAGLSQRQFANAGQPATVQQMFKPLENRLARAQDGASKNAVKASHSRAAASRGGKSVSKLHDKQSEPDYRELRIDKVGVRGLRFPITVRDKERAFQNTVATIGMFVDLPKEFKGTHMSRFLEVLNAHGNVIHVENITEILYAMQKKFAAATSHLEIEFPYFMVKKAPVTGMEGVMDYVARFDATACHHEIDFVLTVKARVTTLCPCSKAIASHGAHNQRGEVTVQIRSRKSIWIEDLIQIIEAAHEVLTGR